MSLSENQKVQSLQIWNQKSHNVDKQLAYFFFMKIASSYQVQTIFFISDPLL